MVTPPLVDIRQLAAKSGLTVEETLIGLAGAERKGWIKITALSENRYHIEACVLEHAYGCKVGGRS